jgi:hypothetical protein
MKNKLLSLASLLAVFNVNAIEIGPTGSGVELSGFVDVATSKQGNNSETTAAQVELNLGYTMGPVSAAVGLDFGESSVYGNDADNGNLEEAYITYDFGNGFSVTGGRMLSYMGFEAFDPTNMYQFSYAYDVEGAQDIYDAYDTGASIDYSSDMFSVGLWSSLESDAGFEYAFAFTGVENLTAKAIWSDFSAPGSDSYEKSTFWVSYQMGKLLLAAEVAEKDSLDAGTAVDANGNPAPAVDVDGMMIMANYAVTDSAAITLRYSETEYSTFAGAKYQEGSKFTVSPSYIFTDNLSGLLEYSSYDADLGTEKEELLAAEVIFTF